MGVESWESPWLGLGMSTWEWDLGGFGFQAMSEEGLGEVGRKEGGEE